MRTLVVEDDVTSRLLLQEMLKKFGEVSVAMDGQEAVAAVRSTLAAGSTYDLICLDIMMPQLDGQGALKQIRHLEEERGTFSTDGAKIIMTTALNDMKNVATAYNGLCDGYLVKPVDRTKLLENLQRLGLVP